MDEGASSQILGELHNTVTTSEHDSFDLASPHKEDVDPTQQTLFFPNAQGDWLSPPVHSSSSSSTIHAMKAVAAASRAASNAGNSDGSSAGPGASTPDTSDSGDLSANGHRGPGSVDAPGDEEMDDSMADEEENHSAEGEEKMKGAAGISLYKFTPLGLSEEGTGEILDEDGDVDTEGLEDAGHGRAKVDTDGGDVTTEDGEEVVHDVPEDTIPEDAILEDAIPEDALPEDAEKAAVDVDMSDAPENAPIIIDDDDFADHDSLLMQVPELSKEQKAYKALHQKAWNLIPHKQAPARYWVAVLHHTVEPKDVRKEKDFLWIKANHVSVSSLDANSFLY